MVLLEELLTLLDDDIDHLGNRTLDPFKWILKCARVLVFGRVFRLPHLSSKDFNPAR